MCVRPPGDEKRQTDRQKDGQTKSINFTAKS